MLLAIGYRCAAMPGFEHSSEMYGIGEATRRTDAADAQLWLMRKHGTGALQPSANHRLQWRDADMLFEQAMKMRGAETGCGSQIIDG